MRHLNLLPRERRLNLTREILIVAGTQFMFSLAIGLGILTVVGLIAGVSLFGFSFFASERAVTVELELRLDEYRDARSEIHQTNSLLESVIAVDDSRTEWSSHIGDLLLIMPPGMTITSLVASEQDQNVSFGGTAPTRASLVLFEEQLRALPWVLGVDAPRDNLLSRIDGEYSYSVQVRMPEPINDSSDVEDTTER